MKAKYESLTNREITQTFVNVLERRIDRLCTDMGLVATSYGNNEGVFLQYSIKKNGIIVSFVEIADPEEFTRCFKPEMVDPHD